VQEVLIDRRQFADEHVVEGVDDLWFAFHARLRGVVYDSGDGGAP
jgi:hypothetical protein